MKKKQKYSNEEYIIYGINGCLNLLKTKNIEDNKIVKKID